MPPRDQAEILEELGYLLGYEDGLNKFYVAKEHASLPRTSRVFPPSVFDNYTRYNEFVQNKFRRLPSRFNTDFDRISRGSDRTCGRIDLNPVAASEIKC